MLWQQHGAIRTHAYSLYVYRNKTLTSLSKLSICRSWMADRMLVTWNLLVMLKMVSRSFRVREFSTLPSTSWLWKTCEYCGSPMSLSQHLDTQWWSMSAAFESLGSTNRTTSNNEDYVSVMYPIFDYVKMDIGCLANAFNVKYNTWKNHMWILQVYIICFININFNVSLFKL